MFNGSAAIGVFGAYGAQGGAIAGALESRDVAVRCFGTKARMHGQAHESVRVDLGEQEQVTAALRGLEAISLTIPLEYDARRTRLYAENIAHAVKQNDVRRVVFNTNTRIPARLTAVPAFETRRVVEDVLRQSGIPLTIVRPAMYLENLLAPTVAAEVISNGVLRYPVPAETPIAWISLKDLGSAVASALLDDGRTGEDINIGGEDLTGPQLASHLQRALDRPVTFEAMDPTRFEDGLALAIGTQAAHGVAGLYHWINVHPETSTMSGGYESLRTLGVTPGSATEWAGARWPALSSI
ncbi:NmrA family NAD(P)-binding protein [Luteipulveratus mongoliensis]|uniref:NmrA-like domain-containing protein n=1 Tax=Luteipulveratus mongoliensis TaxID=571913 RepID=A0A0K1JDN2_9MICO|nr:NmrA family NAD(P)-binding protein [Luteipulveratus mongoliensis]AKU14816.1 hypothetical protein VV02_01265 [Luteipulveratus mongoliensis]